MEYKKEALSEQMLLYCKSVIESSSRRVKFRKYSRPSKYILVCTGKFEALVDNLSTTEDVLNTDYKKATSASYFLRITNICLKKIR